MQQVLRVKKGRKYYLEGREFGEGQTVDKYIPPSYIPGLTNAYGPLEYVAERQTPMQGRAVNAGDMAPARVMTAPPATQPQELQPPFALTPAQQVMQPARNRTPGRRGTLTTKSEPPKQ